MNRQHSELRLQESLQTAGLSGRLGVAPNPEAVATVARDLEKHGPELTYDMAVRYPDEVSDYHRLSQATLLGDVREMSLENLYALTDRLQGKEVLSRRMEQFCRAAARRWHQGISLEAHLNAYHVWSREIWKEIIRLAGKLHDEASPTALYCGLTILEHLSSVIGRVSAAYIHEMDQRPTDHGDEESRLVRALCKGDILPDEALRQMRAAYLTTDEAYAVLIIRGHSGNEGRSLANSLAPLARSVFVPPAGNVLLGEGRGELDVIYPGKVDGDLAKLREEALRLQTGISLRPHTAKILITIGQFHFGLEGIPTSYREAEQTAYFAETLDLPGIVFTYEGVLVYRLLQSQPDSARRLAEQRLGGLLEYDQRHGSEMVLTLKSYLETDGNVVELAHALNLHPNTVLYRLERITKLTGRDPRQRTHWIEFYLALRALELMQAAQKGA